MILYIPLLHILFPHPAISLSVGDILGYVSAWLDQQGLTVFIFAFLIILIGIAVVYKITNHD